MTDSNTSRRRFLEATGGAASALALAGCTGGDDPTTTASPETTEAMDPDTTEAMDPDTTEEDDETTSGDTEQSGTYRFVNSTATTFDPVASTDEASGYVIQQLYDCLTNYPDGTTATENLLADDLEVADDNVTYTFQLKEGVTFSDGTEFTASDVIYSFERLAASNNSRRQSFILGDLNIAHETETVTTTNEDGEEVEQEEYVAGSLEMNAPDDYTLEMTLASPFHASLELLAYGSFSVVPEGIVGDIEGYSGEKDYNVFATEEPVGTGPFVLENWSEGTEIELSAKSQDEYYREGPYVEGVHMQIIEKTNPHYTYATTNMNADHPYVPSSKYDPEKVSVEETDDRGRQIGEYGPLENGLTVPYYKIAEVGQYYFGFNCDAVDKPARQAFAHAHNAHEVNSQVFKDRNRPAYFFTPPAIFPGGASNYEQLAQEYPYGYNATQIDEATSVMEEAGYSESDQYEFTMTTYQSAQFQQAAQLAQDKLGAAHVDMKLEQTPFSTLTTRGRNGDLDAYTLGWIADYPAPDNFLKLLNPPFTQTSGDQTISYFNWDGTEAAEQAKEGWSYVDEYPLPTDEHQQQRNEGYLMMERANWEDAVLIGVMHNVAEHMDYPWLDKPRAGAMGSARQKWNTVQIGDRSEYQ